LNYAPKRELLKNKQFPIKIKLIMKNKKNLI